MDSKDLIRTILCVEAFLLAVFVYAAIEHEPFLAGFVSASVVFVAFIGHGDVERKKVEEELEAAAERQRILEQIEYDESLRVQQEYEDE